MKNVYSNPLTLTAKALTNLNFAQTKFVLKRTSLKLNSQHGLVDSFLSESLLRGRRKYCVTLFIHIDSSQTYICNMELVFPFYFLPTCKRHYMKYVIRIVESEGKDNNHFEYIVLSIETFDVKCPMYQCPCGFTYQILTFWLLKIV